MSDSSPLFESYALGSLELPNRAVMAPMTRSRAIGSIPNERMAGYYRQRSEAGLIVTEGTSPSPDALGYPRIPGVWTAEQVEGWKLVADAVHGAGGRIFMQLMHTGRVTHPDNLPEGGRVLAPSAVELADTKMWVDESMGEEPIPVAEPMTTEEIETAIEEFGAGARNAIEAGFDGIELHGANGYLIEQFLHPHTNLREDEWGGSVEHRRRFVLRVARRCAEAIGGERVGIRLSPYGVFNEMPQYDGIDETYIGLAGELGEVGLAYLHVVDHSAMGAPELPDHIKPALKEAFGRTVILSGGYDFISANEDLAADRADLIAFGKPFLANPDLLERFRVGAELNEPDFGTFYTPGEEGYTDYPTLEEGGAVAAD